MGARDAGPPCVQRGRQACSYHHQIVKLVFASDSGFVKPKPILRQPGDQDRCQPDRLQGDHSVFFPPMSKMWLALAALLIMIMLMLMATVAMGRSKPYLSKLVSGAVLFQGV